LVIEIWLPNSPNGRVPFEVLIEYIVAADKQHLLLQGLSSQQAVGIGFQEDKILDKL
jgi:hypothetical protein